MDQKYWIAVVSKNHVQRGMAGEFMQVCHGKAGPLKRIKSGDKVLFYSPKETFEGSEKCQKFTAVCTVTDDIIYQVEMAPDFFPFRRDVSFEPARESSILPLLPQLQFIADKRHWGYIFRTGLFEIPYIDFLTITASMKYGEKEIASV